MKIVVTCSCGGVVEKATRLYKEQFGGVPEKVYKGGDSIRRFANTLPATTNMHQHLMALAKVKNKFIYSIEYDESGIITEMYDLQKKVRIA
jgi:hypothetical protein